MGNSLKLNPRERRKLRVRKKVVGTTERPRLCIFKSIKYTYAQLISDVDNRVVCSVVSGPVSVEGATASAKSVPAAFELGKKLAEAAKGLAVEGIVFDRNGFRYHGRVKAVADGAREAGLQF